jgi:hypothetical protein
MVVFFAYFGVPVASCSLGRTAAGLTFRKAQWIVQNDPVSIRMGDALLSLITRTLAGLDMIPKSEPHWGHWYLGTG